MAARKPKPDPEAVPADLVPPPPSVTLTKPDGSTHKFLLVVPTSLALRHQVTWGALKNEVEAPMAALGLCSVSIRKVIGPYRHDLFGYGAAVLEHLLGEGYNFFDALEAGNVAWRLMSEGVIVRSEVEAVEGFTEAPTAGST